MFLSINKAATMALELVLLLCTLTICEGSMLVTQDPPVTLPPSGVLPPANLVDADIMKIHLCLLPGEEGSPFLFSCPGSIVMNSAVGGWSSVFDNGTNCPVTNPECTVSQLEEVIDCDLFTNCQKYFRQIDIDVPGCTEPTNFIDIEHECAKDVRPYPPDPDHEGNLFVQYDDDIEYETVLIPEMRRISMVENLLLESDRQLVLGINHKNISAEMLIMFTFRASREIYVNCFDELTDTGPCSSHPCLNGGSCFYKPVGFKCQCADGFMGQFCEIEPGKYPLVENVNPLYGPVAGGTWITVTGQHFPVNASAVLLGTIQCPIIHETTTEILSLTPEVGESLVGMNLPVSVKFLGGLVVTSDYDYTYRNNPIIESIYPLTTIKQGGTKLTISGEFMDSVYKPVLEITMVIRETTENDNGDFITTETQENYTEVCDIGNDNSNKLICYTPAIDNVPDDILNTSRNCTQINLPIVNIDIYEVKTPDIPFRKPQEREEPTHCISGTFYLGMALDGLNVYKNISEHPDISEYGTIKIFPTPTFDIVRRVFEKGKMEIFEGDNVASVGELDYTVWMGSDDCQVMDVKENALTCLPYEHFPTDGSKMKEQAFDIIVGIGTNFNTTIGSMVNKPKLPFVVAGVVLAGVLIALVIILAIVFTRKNEKTKNAQERASDIIHLPDVNWNDLSDKALDQPGSTVTDDSIGYYNTAQLSDVHNNADNEHCEGTRQPYIRRKRCVTMDVPSEMRVCPPPLPKREKCHIYENVP